MKVILLQDVAALGRKRDVKDVSDGYARNFLIPHKLAMPASAAAMQALTAQKAREDQAKAAEDAQYRASAEKLKTLTLSFKTKIGEKGKAFGSITAAKIRDALKKEGIAIEKEWIVLDDPIKTTGGHTVEVKFPPDIVVKMRVVVEAE